RCTAALGGAFGRADARRCGRCPARNRRRATLALFLWRCEAGNASGLAAAARTSCETIEPALDPHRKREVSRVPPFVDPGDLPAPPGLGKPDRAADGGCLETRERAIQGLMLMPRGRADPPGCTLAGQRASGLSTARSAFDSAPAIVFHGQRRCDCVASWLGAALRFAG